MQSQNWTMTQVLAVGAVVAVSLGTGALVGSAAPTSLYASTAVQPAVAVRPAVAPVAPRTAQIRRAAQAPVAQAVAAAGVWLFLFAWGLHCCLFPNVLPTFTFVHRVQR